MTKREAARQYTQTVELVSLGFTRGQAAELRRISMTLHRWHERECGTDRGCIERDEVTGRPMWTYYDGGKGVRSYPVPDRERGALKRLAAIVATVPGLSYYIQTDPRGCALYIIRPGDVGEGQSVESCYSRGVAVY